jgi:hypothetical protein
MLRQREKMGRLPRPRVELPAQPRRDAGADQQPEHEHHRRNRDRGFGHRCVAGPCLHKLLSSPAKQLLAKMRLGQQCVFKFLNCSSAKISLFRQKGGAKLMDSGAQSSQVPQARFEGQDSQRCDAVAYSRLNRGTTPPLGSMPNLPIILKA